MHDGPVFAHGQVTAMNNFLTNSPIGRLPAGMCALASRPWTSRQSEGSAAGGWSLAMLCLPVAMLVGWLCLVVTGDGRLDALGNPVGGDYAMFHIAGEMATAGHWSSLYDEPAQQRALLEHFPQLPSDTYLPFRYPPLVAIVVAPLTWLPYPLAFMLFTFLSVSVWLASWWLLVETFFDSTDRRAGVDRLLPFLVMAPVAAQAVIDGQASLFWFAIAATTWCALHHGRPVWAGCIFALAACKPNVMLLLGVVWIVRHPRMLLGILPTGLVMLGITLSLAGSDCLMRYVQLAGELAASPWQVETPYWKVQSLLSWSELWLGSHARQTHLILGVIAAAFVGLMWRRNQQNSNIAEPLALSCGLGINALLNPYTPVYDLTLLQLGLFAWLVYAAKQAQIPALTNDRRVRAAVAAVWIGPIISQAVSKSIASPLQFMPIALLFILAGLIAMAFKSSSLLCRRPQQCL